MLLTCHSSLITHHCVMKPERWDQIDHLLQSALRQSPSQRDAFLKEACGGDEVLRQEVESLLEAHERAGSFLEAPAMEVEARALADSQGQTGVGRMIGHYRVLAPLGAGGMGEVYRARDSRLGREFAIKVLPAQFTQDEDRLWRFIQEAKAASALNHPNIITIHEIGEEQGTHYIAAELIDGRTLRQQMADEKFKLLVALDVAVQVASALAAAHEAGIVHRDIKPENIMVRRDSLVKVLDFGLAKLTERRASTPDTEAPTLARVDTDPGTVMGTVSYMSPEQARGLKVDARTDIFSLGVVLYEMVAGRAPFAGGSAAEVFAAILEKQPVALGRLEPETPAELERIVSKALAKDREERYQTVKDLQIDLKRLKQRLEYEQYREREGGEALLERSAATMQNGAAIERSSGQTVTATTAQAAASTGEAGAVRTTSSAEIIISEIKRHKRGALLVVAALVVITTGVAFGLYKWIGHNQSKSALPFQAAKLTPITTHGRAVAAAISPDGKYVAYAMEEDRKQSLWLRQVAISSNAPIVPPAEVQYSSLTFSRDGNFLYYSVRDQNDPALSGLHQMTFLGRNQRRLIAGLISGLTLSPDGHRLAFVRINGQARETTLLVANADGSNEQTLAARRRPDDFHGPLAWSPDGKVIACSVGGSGNDIFATLVTVNVESKAEKPLAAHQWDNIGSVAWLTGGSGLVISALDRALGPSAQLWELSYPGGEERKLTNDLNDYRGSSLTADSSALLTLQENLSLSLWIVPKGEAGGATQITSRTGKSDGERGVAWTPDGKIVYSSTASGSLDLWLMNADGSNQKQLTMNAGRNHFPAVSPDGRYIVFASNRAGQNGLWRMNADGSAPQQLDSTGLYPQCSPDGKWVIYVHRDARGRFAALWKVSMEGGTPVQLTDEPSQRAAISPDGKLIAYFLGGAQGKIRVMPFEGGPPIKTFDPPLTMVPLRWTPDGRALTYVNTTGGVSNLWSQPLDGGPPKQLTDFKAEQIFAFDSSRDGQLLVSRGVTNRDVVLISGFR